MAKETIETPQSSNIAQFEYDFDTRELVVTFTGGNKYCYEDVPNDLIEQMKEAESVGRFFSQNVRNRYSYEQIPPEN